jgi:hypothetical protein
VRLPAPPGLQHHVVPLRGERAAEGDRRECVAGVAEGAEEQAQAGQPLSSATRRNCSMRSSFDPATGVIPSVPTPASR